MEGKTKQVIGWVVLIFGAIIIVSNLKEYVTGFFEMLINSVIFGLLLVVIGLVLVKLRK